MVAIYVRRIMSGLMTIDDVPVYWRDKVELELKEQGYQTDGAVSPEK